MKGSPGSHAGRLLRETLPVAAVALLVFQSLRTFFLERYLVPSGSMEPTLFGDAERGDIVLVNKLPSWLPWTLRRYDLVVMRNPENPDRHIVKRAVAFGDETQRNHVWIEGGDLWLGPDPQRLERQVKDPVADADLRISWLEFPAATPEGRGSLHLPKGAERTAEHLRIPAAAPSSADLESMLTVQARGVRLSKRPAELHLPGHLATDKVVDTSFLDAEGRRRGSSGAKAVRDCGVEATVVVDEGTTGLQLVLGLRPADFSWSLDLRGNCRFLRDGVLVTEVGDVPELLPGTPTDVEFGFLDNHFFLVVAGRLLMHERWRPEWGEGPRGDRRQPENRLHVGAAGTSGVRLDRLRVFRDIYYFRDRIAMRDQRADHVLPGHLYLLGDNSSESQDSRTQTQDAFPLSDLVGRPVMVLGPRPRLRWLHR